MNYTMTPLAFREFPARGGPATEKKVVGAKATVSIPVRNASFRAGRKKRVVFTFAPKSSLHDGYAGPSKLGA